MSSKTRNLKKLSLFVFSTLILSTSLSLHEARASDPVRILVRPKSGLSDTEFKKIIGAHGGRSVQRIDQIGVHVIELPATANARAVAEVLKNNPNIKFAEVDEKAPAAMAINDPSYGSEWHLPKIGAPAAWDITQGAGVTIAILDSGVYGAHPDLAPNMVAGWNFVDNNSNTSDVCKHGTWVAGVAAAKGNDGIGVAGVAFNSKIMPVRIAFPDGSGGCYAYYSTMASGITYAADHGAKVANLSYAAAGSSTVISAAQYMVNKGGITTVSAENTGTNLSYADSILFVVGSTNSSDVISSFSSYGTYVDLSAPGDHLYTTNSSGGYSTVEGTSFAAPTVGAVAALMYAANPSIKPSQVMSILDSTAVDLGTAGYDIHYGHGRVNAAAAVQAAKNLVAPDTTVPVALITSPSNGATVSGLVSVNVSASDNIGVTKVELYANGALVATDTASPYSFSWDSTKVANGTVNLVAKAYDAAGNVGVSSGDSVKVANVAPSPTPSPSPTVSPSPTPSPSPSPTPSPSPSPTSTSTTWVKCASEGQTCTVSGTKTVRYGRGTSWTSKVVTNSIGCNNTAFGGDPAYGYVKECDVAQ